MATFLLLRTKEYTLYYYMQGEYICGCAPPIVHPESLDLTSKTQSRLHAEISHASIATMSLRAFICVRVRAFTFVCEYSSRSTAYVRA